MIFSINFLRWLFLFFISAFPLLGSVEVLLSTDNFKKNTITLITPKDYALFLQSVTGSSSSKEKLEQKIPKEILTTLYDPKMASDFFNEPPLHTGNLDVYNYGKERQQINFISYLDAASYCNWMEYRLNQEPTYFFNSTGEIFSKEEISYSILNTLTGFSSCPYSVDLKLKSNQFSFFIFSPLEKLLLPSTTSHEISSSFLRRCIFGGFAAYSLFLADPRKDYSQSQDLPSQEQSLISLPKDSYELNNRLTTATREREEKEKLLSDFKGSAPPSFYLRKALGNLLAGSALAAEVSLSAAVIPAKVFLLYSLYDIINQELQNRILAQVTTTLASGLVIHEIVSNFDFYTNLIRERYRKIPICFSNTHKNWKEFLAVKQEIALKQEALNKAKETEIFYCKSILQEKTYSLLEKRLELELLSHLLTKHSLWKNFSKWQKSYNDFLMKSNDFYGKEIVNYALNKPSFTQPSSKIFFTEEFKRSFFERADSIHQNTINSEDPSPNKDLTYIAEYAQKHFEKITALQQAVEDRPDKDEFLKNILYGIGHTSACLGYIFITPFIFGISYDYLGLLGSVIASFVYDWALTHITPWIKKSLEKCNDRFGTSFCLPNFFTEMEDDSEITPSIQRHFDKANQYFNQVQESFSKSRQRVEAEKKRENAYIELLNANKKAGLLNEAPLEESLKQLFQAFQSQ